MRPIFNIRYDCRVEKKWLFFFAYHLVVNFESHYNFCQIKIMPNQFRIRFWDSLNLHSRKRNPIIEIQRVYNCSYYSTAHSTYVNCQFGMTSHVNHKYSGVVSTSTRHQDMHGHTFQRKSLARLHCALGSILTALGFQREEEEVEESHPFVCIFIAVVCAPWRKRFCVFINGAVSVCMFMAHQRRIQNA